MIQRTSAVRAADADFAPHRCSTEPSGHWSANAAEQEDVQNVIDQTGIPTEAVSAEVETPMRLLGDLRDKFRPVPGGVKIQWQEFDVPWADAITCTIGPQFEAHRDGYDPVEGFLVNSHCTRAPFDSAASASDPTTYHQATVGDNIGEEVFDPDTWSCTDNPQYGCRGSDAALAVYYADESVGPQLGRIARTDSRNDANYSITLDGTQPRFEVTSALGQYSLQGETLEKVGQLTGWTGGTVINGCVDYPITDGGIVVGPTLVCQVAVAAEAGPGDSGSPVFKIDAGIEVHLRGMLVGGRGECHYINIEGAFVCEEFVASHLGDIEYELGPLLTWYWY